MGLSPRIVNSAVKRGDEIYTAIRHSKAIHMAAMGGWSPPITSSEQGFVTDTGVFVDRQEAFRIAVECGQFTPKPHSSRNTLFSEDLW